MGVNVQMYSIKKIPRCFELSGNPYTDEDARKDLERLGVIFYRDENHKNGVVMPLPELPRKGYYQQLILDDEKWEVDEWSSDDDQWEEALRKKNGDLYAWFRHNSAAIIAEVTPSAVVADR